MYFCQLCLKQVSCPFYIQQANKRGGIVHYSLNCSQSLLIVPFCLRGESRVYIGPKDLPSLGPPLWFGSGPSGLWHHQVPSWSPTAASCPISCFSVHLSPPSGMFFLFWGSSESRAQLVASGHPCFQSLPPAHEAFLTGLEFLGALDYIKFLQRLLNFCCKSLASEMLMKPSSLSSSQHPVWFTVDESPFRHTGFFCYRL